MVNYKELYFELFNQITDAMELLLAGHPGDAYALLGEAQRHSEEMYIRAGE